MEERGPLDAIMEDRIIAEFEDYATIELARVMQRAPDLDFTAHDRSMFMVGFAACLLAVSRDGAWEKH